MKQPSIVLSSIFDEGTTFHEGQLLTQPKNEILTGWKSWQKSFLLLRGLGIYGLLNRCSKHARYLKEHTGSPRSAHYVGESFNEARQIDVACNGDCGLCMDCMGCNLLYSWTHRCVLSEYRENVSFKRVHAIKTCFQFGGSPTITNSLQVGSTQE